MKNINILALSLLAITSGAFGGWRHMPRIWEMPEGEGRKFQESCRQSFTESGSTIYFKDNSLNRRISNLRDLYYEKRSFTNILASALLPSDWKLGKMHQLEDKLFLNIKEETIPAGGDKVVTTLIEGEQDAIDTQLLGYVMSGIIRTNKKLVDSGLSNHKTSSFLLAEYDIQTECTPFREIDPKQHGLPGAKGYVECRTVYKTRFRPTQAK